MLDESGGHELTAEQRRAAELAMDARDRKRGRSPSLPPLQSPGKSLASSPTPGRTSLRLWMQMQERRCQLRIMICRMNNWVRVMQLIN